MPDIISEFRKRYPQYNDIPNAQVYMKLADPKMFKQVFPEYQDLDEHVIGKNIAAEAGKVDSGKPWYEQAWEGIKGMGAQAKENVMTGGKSGQQALLNENKQFREDMAARKAEGRSLPYRAAANTMEGLNLFNARPMEEAANQGHGGEVVGQAVAGAIPYIIPLAVEGVVGAGRMARNAAMEDPLVARQRAMNVPAKSKQAIRAQKEGTAAAPYLKGAKNLADVQARIPAAKQEIFQPYMDAVDAHTATGQTLTGPDGTPMTARQLEELRQQTSAQLKDLRKMQPTDQQAVLQKGQAMKDLNDKYRAITTELDPAIRNYGIDPKRTRATFGAVKGLEKRFEGRSTLLEGKPSGIQKMGDINLTKPETYVGAPASGARDLVAGRGWWTQRPTDFQVREGFRTAGPKPDLTVRPQSPARGLPPGPVVTPPPAATPPSGTVPPVAGTSRAQRLGLLLPEQSESSARAALPAGYTEPAAPGTVNYGEAPPAAPVTATEPPAVQPANMRIVRDPKTGRMKRQYLTSAGGQIIREEPITLKEAMAARPAEITKSGNSIDNINWNEFKTKNPNVSDFSISINRGGKPVAETTLSIVNKDKGILSTENLEVLPDYRKQGLATKLYEQMFDEASRRGFKRINSADSLTKEGQAFWDSLQKKHPEAITTYGEGKTNRTYSIDLNKWGKQVEPKISTDSMGVKWAETPDGIRVSIPKRIPEAEVMDYAKGKLKEQAEMQAKLKGQGPEKVEPIKLKTPQGEHEIVPGTNLYHMSSTGIKEFKPDTISWFSPSSEEANGHLQGAKADSFDKSHIVSSKFQGGKIATEKEWGPIARKVFNAEPIYSMFDESVGEYPKKKVQQFIKQLKDSGYDGAVIKDYSSVNNMKDADSLALFNPSKSVKVTGTGQELLKSDTKPVNTRANAPQVERRNAATEQRVAKLRALVRDSKNAIERRSAAKILKEIYSGPERRGVKPIQGITDIKKRSE